MGVDKILGTIKNQRWFWSRGQPKVIFDRDTALLWTDLNYFLHKSSNNSEYSVDDANAKLKLANENQNLEGYIQWRFLQYKNYGN